MIQSVEYLIISMFYSMNRERQHYSVCTGVNIERIIIDNDQLIHVLLAKRKQSHESRRIEEKNILP